MPRFKEVERDVAELRELADFLENNGVRLPDYWLNNTLSIGLTETNYERGDDGEYETRIDTEGTKQNIKKFLDAVGSCEKDYTDDRIKITKKFRSSDRNMVIGTADRSIACKKVVKGKKFIKEQLIPSRFEEEIEWVCDENISLLKLVQ